MLIKELPDRINFIDKNDNFIGIEEEGRHCGLNEFHWWITDNEREVGTRPPRDNPLQLNDGSKVNVEELIFDTNFEIYRGELKMLEVSNKTGFGNRILEMERSTHVIAAKLVDDVGCVYWLVMSNSHNGYYSLGWESNLVAGYNKDEDPFTQEGIDNRRLEI